MKNLDFLLLSLTLVALMFSCNNNGQSPAVLTENDFPEPPVAALKPDTFNEFGNRRIDPYFWLKEKTNPDVLDYLNA